MTKLCERIVDLAGIRVLVYFPEDVSRVVEEIKKSKDFDILSDAVISYSRNRIDYREKDKFSQLRSGDINYTDGAFAEIPVSVNEIPRRWKNSGYRAVHLHVRLKTRDEPVVDHEGMYKSEDTETESSKFSEFPRTWKHNVTLIVKWTKTGDLYQPKHHSRKAK